MAAVLKCHSEKHSYLNVNKSCLQLLDINESDILNFKAVEITLSKNSSWIFSMKKCQKYWLDSEPIISLNSKLAHSLNIPNDSLAGIQLFSGEIPKIKKIILDPCQEEDWDILISNDVSVEESLLSQIQIVQKNVPLVVFCQNIPFMWRIESLIPQVEFGKIDQGCELIITPKEWHRSSAELPMCRAQDDNSVSINGLLNYLISSSTEKIDK